RAAAPHLRGLITDPGRAYEYAGTLEDKDAAIQALRKVLPAAEANVLIEKDLVTATKSKSEVVRRWATERLGECNRRVRLEQRRWLVGLLGGGYSFGRPTSHFVQGQIPGSATARNAGSRLRLMEKRAGRVTLGAESTMGEV